MINYIWFFIIASGVLFGVFTGQGAVISKGVIESTESATRFVISLVGIMCFWCGVMKVA